MRNRPALGHSVKKKCSGCDKRISIKGREKASLSSVFEGVNSLLEKRSNNKPTPPFRVSRDDYQNKYWRRKKLTAPLPLIALSGAFWFRTVLPGSALLVPYLAANGVFAYYMVKDKSHLPTSSDRPHTSPAPLTLWSVLVRMVIPFIWLYITIGLWPFVHLRLRSKKYEIGKTDGEGEGYDWPDNLPYRGESSD